MHELRLRHFSYQQKVSLENVTSQGVVRLFEKIGNLTPVKTTVKSENNATSEIQIYDGGECFFYPYSLYGIVNTPIIVSTSF